MVIFKFDISLAFNVAETSEDEFEVTDEESTEDEPGEGIEVVTQETPEEKAERIATKNSKIQAFIDQD